MRVTVDPRLCCGYAMCVSACPEVYQLDELGQARVVVDTVPEILEDQARRGAAICPQRAIVVDEED